MLTKLTVENFRSIQDAEVEFGPITVFYGPTSSGKSSLFYSLLILRNFILNPNQAIDGLFNLGFLNLGGYEACIFNHTTSKHIQIIAHFEDQKTTGSYGIKLRKAEVDIISQSESFKILATVPIPYALNQSISQPYIINGQEYSVNWNGFSATVAPSTASEDPLGARTLAEKINLPAEALKRIDICPHRRGFYRPSYTPVPLTPTPTSEDEVATLIINDQNVPPRISIDTTDIFDRDFRIFTPPGTATTFLQTTEQTGARIPGLLVNDGFGVNQVVYMLAKIHRSETETILIEEPEVHLHPTVIRKFVRTVARLASEEQKQLVFTTHSEQFLLSLLGCVKEEIINPDQLCCYNVNRDKKKTLFTRERVSKDGQISGGLSSFMEAELQDIKTFLSPG